MRYGEDKAFEMARSLLPSTSRRSARKQKAIVGRRARSVSKAYVARLVRDAEFEEDCAELDEDHSAHAMKQVVWDRRSGDKVNPFIRWATVRTGDLPRDLRLDMVRKDLPKGLIGDHAISHLKSTNHFMSTGELLAREGWARQYRRKNNTPDRGLLAQLLRQLLRLGDGQKQFNDYLKRACARTWSLQRGHDGRLHKMLHGIEAPRVLRGEHDVLSFLDDIGVESPCPSWRPAQTFGSVSGQAARVFLRAFHARRGDLAATLASLPQQPPLRKAR